MGAGVVRGGLEPVEGGEQVGRGGDEKGIGHKLSVSVYLSANLGAANVSDEDHALRAIYGPTLERKTIKGLFGFAGR